MSYPATMKHDKIDEAVPALLYLCIRKHDPATGART